MKPISSGPAKGGWNQKQTQPNPPPPQPQNVGMKSIEEQIEALTPEERVEYIILLRSYTNENSSYVDYSRKHKELREFENKHGLNTK